MKIFRLVLFLSGCMLSFLLPVNTLLTDLGTCTQGSTNGFIVSGVVPILIVLLFLALTNTGYRHFAKLWWLGWLHIVSLISILMVLPKYVRYTFISGISPCIVSADFQAVTGGTYRTHPWQAEVSFLERTFAPIQLICFLIIVVYFWKMYRSIPKKNNT